MGKKFFAAVLILLICMAPLTLNAETGKKVELEGMVEFEPFLESPHYHLNGIVLQADFDLKVLEGSYVRVKGYWFDGPSIYMRKIFIVEEYDIIDKGKSPAVQVEELPVVGSLQNLEKLLKNQSNSQRSYGGMLMGTGEEMEPQKSSAADDFSSESAPYYSETNIQVEGVDESDIVKTDGRYIYQVRKNKVTVSRAYPVGEMAVIDEIKFDEKEFIPNELYVEGDFLVVIGTASSPDYFYRNFNELPSEEAETDKKIEMIYPPIYPIRRTVKAIVFDISSKDNITALKKVEIEGRYVTSRKTGSHVYIISDKYINFYPRLEGTQANPYYRDSSSGEEFKKIDFNEIRYFPECCYPNYLLIAAFDLHEIEEEAVVEAYLGAGNCIYMSKDNLYAAVSDRINTTIYKFSVKGTKVEYASRGKVEGTVLNQFSMDEYKGYFRIAVTVGNFGSQMSNSVYILDKDLKIVGELTDIAPRERIYSARFAGDKAYLVTFEIFDPLFVLDLSNPEKPEILGALKIPGFSNYLHLLDENHLLGIGRDTVVVERKDGSGNVIASPTVYGMGIKLAIFDVSDLNNPIEKHVKIIGDRGTHSEALQNHKSIMFDKVDGLIAFPVTLREVSEKDDPFSYGTFTFQGAYVFDVDLEKGFNLRGRITHMTTEDCLKSGMYRGNQNSEINRILNIGEVLYTTSNNVLKANHKASLVELKNISLDN